MKVLIFMELKKYIYRWKYPLTLVLFIFRVLLIFNILEVDSTDRREIFIDSLLACVGEIVSRGDEATNSRTYTMYREQKVTELVRFTRRLWEGKSAKGGPEVCSAGALGDVIVFFVFRVFEVVRSRTLGENRTPTAHSHSIAFRLQKQAQIRFYYFESYFAFTQDVPGYG